MLISAGLSFDEGSLKYVRYDPDTGLSGYGDTARYWGSIYRPLYRIHPRTLSRMSQNERPPCKAVPLRAVLLGRRGHQPLVWTTGALPLPTGALPMHPARPKARSTEQITTKNFFILPPLSETRLRVSVVIRTYSSRPTRHPEYWLW